MTTRTDAAAGADRSRSLEELRELIERHVRPDMSTAIDGVLLSKAVAAEDPGGSQSGTVFALIAQGGKRLSSGDRVCDYRAGQYLVASVDVPVSGHYFDAEAGRPALGFGLELRPSTIAALLLEAPPGTIDVNPAAVPPALAVGTADGDLLDAVVRMVRLLDRPADRPILAPMVEREILWRLLTGPLGAQVAQIGVADSCTTRVSRAVRWITEHYSEPFRVEDLASSSGLSVSAFHRKFRGVTALSPIQFQKNVRLQQARLLLLAGADDVTTVAHRVGYDSSTQFNREYKRQFGAPPGRDAERLRATPSQVA
ncbi:AraC family transcriptional regulator [Desertimonas flava]|uniref:AraC family transcriptional regulator n=1 Tax=Desertimonas flava TaxID=2064846 RepID=UPI000E3511A2|nr:AraC family transcriptional regulator [Desertimonas flava]